MVKLQKRFAYKYKEKDHFKYIVTIPSATMEQLDWEPETDLNVTVSNESIILTPAENEERAPKKGPKTEPSHKLRARRGVQH